MWNNRGRRRLARFLALLIAAVGVCFSVTAAQSAESSSWQAEWEKVLAAAEKEGELNIYGQGRAGVGKAIQAFTQVYPKIKINFIEGSGSDLAKKIMAEKRAGKHLVDLSVGGGGTMVM